MSKAINVKFTGDTSDLDRAYNKAGDGGSSFTDGLKKVGIGLGAVAVAGGALAIKIGTDCVKAFMDAEKVSAQTNAVIKSTGSIANVTADDVDKLATAISNKSGIDDEAVASAANLMLTFTGVRNEAGKGNDIFNQSTAILADMATAMGTDVSAGAVQLGKALNDPIAGISALSRVGVTFTDEQKETIKTLVESGRTMDAQKIILAELTKEFGGSAEAAGNTFGGQLNKAKNALDNVKASIGEVLVKEALPAFLEGLGIGGKSGADFAKVGEKITKAIKDAAPEIRAIAKDIGEFIVQVKDVVTWVNKAANSLGKLGGFNLGQNKQKGLQWSDLPGFAAGGPVSGSGPVIVGEKGPEIFWPSTSGMVIPSGSGNGSRPAGNSGPTYITLTLDRQVLAQVTLDELQRYGSRNVTVGLN